MLIYIPIPTGHIIIFPNSVGPPAPCILLSSAHFTIARSSSISPTFLFHSIITLDRCLIYKYI